MPIEFDKRVERLVHLRLHYGTIWRWNRPLVGFEPDRRPHLRAELRPMAAGPTLADRMANRAFAIDLVTALAADPATSWARLPFDAARRDLCEAARLGLDARLQWFDGRTVAAAQLLTELAARARKGLTALGVAPELTGAWMNLIDRRTPRRARDRGNMAARPARRPRR